MEAFLLNLALAPLGLFLGEGDADGLHAAACCVAHHTAPAAAYVQMAVALLEAEFVKDEAILILLGFLQGGVRGGVVGAGVGHRIAQEQLVEIIANVVVIRNDIGIALFRVLGQAVVQFAAQPRSALHLGDRLDLEGAHGC